MAMKLDPVVTMDGGRLMSPLIGESYYRIRHKSGLTVCVLPKKSVTAHAVLGVRCGSVDNCFADPKTGKEIRIPDGTAHFLEHKLFAGEDGEDAMARFARLGAQANAYTTANMTAYLFSCPGDIRKPLSVLLDFVTHPYFTEENVASERSIIEREIRMYEDSPEQTAYYNLLRALYREDPVRISIGGTVESVEQITPETLYTLYRAFYTPDNMVLAVAGDVTPEAVLAVCDACMPSKSEASPVRRIRPREPSGIVLPRREARMQISRPLLYIGTKDLIVPETAEARMKKAEAAGILNDILFSKSSRFFNALYEEGVVNGHFGMEYELTADHGFTLLAAETDRTEELTERFLAYTEERRRLHDITPEQFERCKRVMYAGAVTAFESAEEMVWDCLDYAMEDTELFASIHSMVSLTPEDIYDCLDTLYHPEQTAVSCVYPLSDDGARIS